MPWLGLLLVRRAILKEFWRFERPTLRLNAKSQAYPNSSQDFERIGRGERQIRSQTHPSQQ
jgi:hypothetical protein